MSCQGICRNKHVTSSSSSSRNCQPGTGPFLFDKQQAATRAQPKGTRCHDSCAAVPLFCMQLCLRLSGSRHVLCPPLPLGPPPGEVSLQPLLEVMQPDSLVGLFAAVLLEQRVLLRVSVFTQSLCVLRGPNCNSRATTVQQPCVCA